MLTIQAARGWAAGAALVVVSWAFGGAAFGQKGEDVPLAIPRPKPAESGARDKGAAQRPSPANERNASPGIERPAQSSRSEAAPPGGSFRDCDFCPEMIWLPPGEFMMGSPAGERGREGDERPQHRVRIDYPLAVGRYEVTFDEFDRFVPEAGHFENPRDKGWGRGRRPVIDVSWNDAQAYVEWLSSKTGKRYRLLSEAEWEYAARAGTTARYPWGDEVGRNNANCNGCGSPWDGRQTAPVGSFAANRFGLHDMIGNVWEWVEDCWHYSYKRAWDVGRPDWTSGECGRRVVRGGAWNKVPENARAANRSRFEPRDRSSNLGFRVARTLP